MGRMAEGKFLKRAFKRIVTGYKSLPGIVVRTIVATLLGTGDLVSDLYTTVSLFSLSHPCAASRRGSLSLVRSRLWPHLWLRICYVCP